MSMAGTFITMFKRAIVAHALVIVSRVLAAGIFKLTVITHLIGEPDMTRRRRGIFHLLSIPILVFLVTVKKYQAIDRLTVATVSGTGPNRGV